MLTNNVYLPCLLNYRKEPITGFIITAGAVNALVGGVGGIGTPFILGLVAAGGSIAYRWWMIQQTEH
jgi:4-hydroxybenzoate polyprenyltransferase